MLLNKEAAEEAIRDRIAEPLGLGTIEAAALIRRLIDEKMSSAIRKEVTLRGYRPSEFVIFAIGGAGPTHVAGYMGEIPRAVIFPFSPVFCAYGSSIMDVVHLYEQSQRMMLIAPFTRTPAVDFAAFNAVVDGLVEQARKEVLAEGLPWESAVLSLELDMLYGGQIHSKRTSTPALRLESEDDVWRFYRQFEEEFSAAFSPLVVNLDGGVYIDTFVLRVTVPGKRVDLPAHPLQGADPSAAQTGTRRAYWPGTGDFAETPVYALGGLLPGNRLEGPAIVESEYTTAVIPPDRKLTIEEHGLGIIENRDR
jgi:N-methylhydantoinase A/acetophenone carboxylase